MIIQMNFGKALSNDNRIKEYFTSEIKESLNRYQSYITRIEVHLKNENGSGGGLNTVSCMLEARLKGRQPIAITNQADNMVHAVTGATAKIETAIETIVGRIHNN